MPKPIHSVSAGVLVALGSFACAFVLGWPRETYAEEIEDWQRAGEYDEDGARFGNIVVEGKLVAAAGVPGGWVLVRTFENKGDAFEEAALEERVLRTETMPDARVEPPPTAVVLRHQKIALAAHQKKTIGVPLPEDIGAQITAGVRDRATLMAARDRAVETGRPNPSLSTRTYMAFHVEYLTPLPPGAVAAPHPNVGIAKPYGYAGL